MLASFGLSAQLWSRRLPTQVVLSCNVQAVSLRPNAAAELCGVRLFIAVKRLQCSRTVLPVFSCLQIDKNVERELINHRSLLHPNIIRFKEVRLDSCSGRCSMSAPQHAAAAPNHLPPVSVLRQQLAVCLHDLHGSPHTCCLPSLRGDAVSRAYWACSLAHTSSHARNGLLGLSLQFEDVLPLLVATSRLPTILHRLFYAGSGPLRGCSMPSETPARLSVLVCLPTVPDRPPRQQCLWRSCSVYVSRCLG